jgi:site-specific recombinase XerD
VAVETLTDLIPSFERHLRAKNRAPRTVTDYVRSAQMLADELGPIDVRAITKGQIEDYIDGITQRTSAGHSASHYRRLQQLFRWLLNEEEITDSPMRRMSPPHVPDKPVPVIPPEEITRLLAVCKGRRFEDRRDEALIRLMIDTGIRVAELVGMDRDDVHFDYQTISVLGKGRRLRSVPFGSKTSEAMDRYLRARRHHHFAELPSLWLGSKGPFTAWGVRQMLDRRCAKAEIGRINPHRFRHSAAHEWLAAGGQEGDLEMLMGWSKSSGMTRRYGRSAAEERARSAHARMGLGDRY